MKMRPWVNFGHYVAFITCTGLVGGCTTSTPVKHAVAKTTLQVKSAEKAKPIQFRKIVVKVPRGTRIGTLSAGLLCVPNSPLTWRGGDLALTGDELSDVFRDELRKANYTVVGNPDSLFEDSAEWKAELVVAGLVREMQVNVCLPKSGFGDASTAKGESYMKVDWQVYARLDRKVVFELSTDGSTKIEKARAGGLEDLILQSFGVATQNLLADSGFHKLVTGTGEKPLEVVAARLKLRKLQPRESVINQHMNDVRAAVVTVFAGDGHGSGFFIDPTGYLLTGEHVVRGAKFVKVKLPTGRELLGEVIRTSPRRDVALVKVEETNMTALPLAAVDANVGEEVFAIGSPLDERFSTSVSKGVVSSHRMEDGLRFIQSDVNMLPGNSGGPLLDRYGNVVAFAGKGIFIAGAPAGLNFFVPVKDACEALAVQFE